MRCLCVVQFLINTVETMSLSVSKRGGELTEITVVMKSHFNRQSQASCQHAAT